MDRRDASSRAASSAGGTARRPRPSPVPRPFFTLGLLYLFGLFVLFCLVMVAPALLEVARSVPPGPEQQAAAEAAARRAVQGKLGWAFVAATLALALGAWRGWLPGLRR